MRWIWYKIIPLSLNSRNSYIVGNLGASSELLVPFFAEGTFPIDRGREIRYRRKEHKDCGFATSTICRLSFLLFNIIIILMD